MTPSEFLIKKKEQLENEIADLKEKLKHRREELSCVNDILNRGYIPPRLHFLIKDENGDPIEIELLSQEERKSLGIHVCRIMLKALGHKIAYES